jgi:hypothetical protein
MTEHIVNKKRSKKEDYLLFNGVSRADVPSKPTKIAVGQRLTYCKLKAYLYVSNNLIFPNGRETVCHFGAFWAIGPGGEGRGRFELWFRCLCPTPNAHSPTPNLALGVEENLEEAMRVVNELTTCDIPPAGDPLS